MCQWRPSISMLPLSLLMCVVIFFSLHVHWCLVVQQNHRNNNINSIKTSNLVTDYFLPGREPNRRMMPDVCNSKSEYNILNFQKVSQLTSCPADLGNTLPHTALPNDLQQGHSTCYLGHLMSSKSKILSPKAILYFVLFTILVSLFSMVLF